jgi:hypothetical protein
VCVFCYKSKNIFCKKHTFNGKIIRNDKDGLNYKVDTNKLNVSGTVLTTGEIIAVNYFKDGRISIGSMPSGVFNHFMDNYYYQIYVWVLNRHFCSVLIHI